MPRNHGNAYATAHGEHTCDLAFSAVASDAALVGELIADVGERLLLAARYDAQPISSSELGDVALMPSESGPRPEHPRVVVVLHQHLWAHDGGVREQEVELRRRAEEEPGSVCVVALDDVPLPRWLANAPRYGVSASGRAGVADFVMEVVAAAGGAVKPKLTDFAVAAPAPRWPEGPAPFLAQPRAHSALRHELDALAEELEEAVDRSKLSRPDGVFELQVLPHRLVLRLDDVAVTFSWLSKSSTSIADGRLLVIAWRDLARAVRGPAALKSAAMIHESSYAADCRSADSWRWRGEDAARQAYSSANLAAAWIARAGIASCA